MSDKIDAKKIKKIAEELLKKIDQEAKIETFAEVDQTIVIGVKTIDGETLVGQNGETLQAIQHLLRVMVRKLSDVPCYIDLDVNDYRKKRRDYLKELAVSSANDAALAKKEISLPPMNSYERRIVHMELAERRDVSTESRGCDLDRRIVIKPAE
jgi:spoIIIJ-associated protein